VFRRLGVFAGSFDRSTAGAVLTLHGEDAADVEAVVPALVRDALVQVDRRDAGRLHFRLLSVVRGLALEAVPAGELDQLRLRHRRWFADWWSRELGRDELFQDIRDHQEDYLQALTTALADGDGAAATDLALTLAEQWQLSGARWPAPNGSPWPWPALHSRRRDAQGCGCKRAALLQNHDPDQVLADTGPHLRSRSVHAHRIRWCWPTRCEPWNSGSAATPRSRTPTAGCRSPPTGIGGSSPRR
jgi:hypothetical protein